MWLKLNAFLLLLHSQSSVRQKPSLKPGCPNLFRPSVPNCNGGLERLWPCRLSAATLSPSSPPPIPFAPLSAFSLLRFLSTVPLSFLFQSVGSSRPTTAFSCGWGPAGEHWSQSSPLVAGAEAKIHDCRGSEEIPALSETDHATEKQEGSNDNQNCVGNLDTHVKAEPRHLLNQSSP